MNKLNPAAGLVVLICLLVASAANSQENTEKRLNVDFRMLSDGLFRYFDDPQLEAADRLYVLASRVFRTGSYLRSGFLFMDAAEIYQRAHRSQREPLPSDDLGINAIYRGLSSAFLLAGHVNTALEYYRSAPQSSQEISEIKDIIAPPPTEIVGLYRLDDGDEICRSPEGPVRWNMWLTSGGKSLLPLGVTTDSYTNAVSSYGSGDYSNAAVQFVQAADEFSGDDSVWPSRYSDGRSNSYYCAVHSYFLAGKCSDGVEDLCQRVWREPSADAVAVLVNGIQLLSGRRHSGINEICTTTSSERELQRISVDIHRGWDGCENVGPELSAECEADSVIAGWQVNGKYDAIGGLARAIGLAILVSLDDTPYFCSGDGRCSNWNRLDDVLEWFRVATNAYLMSGGAFYAKAEMERINKSVPKLFDLLGPGYFYILDATYVDPHRSILRQGIDAEELSTSRSATVLFDSRLNQGFRQFLGEANTRNAEGFFSKGERLFGVRRYKKAASAFFGAALNLNVNCETDLCRDALWVWRAHAVWNAVTSLRQMGNPVKACEEARKFVILAGEGHQKSAAADVEDALCGDLPEHVPDRDELN